MPKLIAPSAAFALLTCAAALPACGDDDTTPMHDGGTECLAPLSLDCHPTYAATYDLLFDNLFRQSCGATSNCHYGPTADKAQAGLVLSQRDDAYDYLLGKMDGRARVVPKKPECSILVQRLESMDASFRMPVGKDPLPVGDRCVVRQWIANGAKR